MSGGYGFVEMVCNQLGIHRELASSALSINFGVLGRTKKGPNLVSVFLYIKPPPLPVILPVKLILYFTGSSEKL